MRTGKKTRWALVLLLMVASELAGAGSQESATLFRPVLYPELPGQTAGGGASGEMSGAGQVLVFQRDPVVLASVKKQLVRQTGQIDPADARLLKQHSARRDYPEAFEALFGHYGYQDNNLADIAAACIMQGWRIANDRPEPSAKAWRALQEQVRGLLLGRPELVRASSQQKQQAADPLLIRTVLMADAWQQLKQKPDRELASEFSDSMAAMLASSMNIDVRRLQLTVHGMRDRP